MKPKTKKKPTLSTAKKKAWSHFSLYIRSRDALKTTGTLVSCVCVTCRVEYPIQKIQAGHFVPGRTNAVLFDERGVNGQCQGCNLFKGGAPHDYWLWMEQTYGREVIDELLSQRHVSLKMKVWDYDELAARYKTKLKALKEDYARNE